MSYLHKTGVPECVVVGGIGPELGGEGENQCASPL